MKSDLYSRCPISLPRHDNEPSIPSLMSFRLPFSAKMMNFQRPENALKRSEELLEVGRPEDALEVLRQALQTRRFRFVWSDAMEDIMKSYIRLCGQLKKIRNVKEGLMHYRSACQTINLPSFESVVRFFCQYSEDIVTAAKSRLPTSIFDLDEYETPQSLLLTAFGADGTTEDERSARQSLKNLWDTYRTALEVTRSHQAVEDVFHEIAAKACNFCLTYGRKNEFRRLCELLRSYHQYLPRTATVTQGPQVVCASNPETISKTLETRDRQMKVAIDMGIWTTAYQVAEDMQSLMQRKRPSPQQLKGYYDSLSKVFWVSGQRFLFHAYTSLRAFVLGRQLGLNGTNADQVVLAVLAALSEDGSQTEQKISLLSGGAPVPEQLLAELQSRGVVALASPLVQEIFMSITEGKDEAGLLEKLPSDLQPYTAPLRRVMLIRTLVDLCAVYSTMTFAEFKKRTGSIGSDAEVDRAVSYLRSAGLADIRLDYVAEIARFRRQVDQLVSLESSSSTSDYEAEIDAERAALSDRRSAIAKKRSDAERKAKEAEEERLKRAKESDELAREAAAKKAEEDVKRREVEARERAKQARELEKAKELEERIKDEKVKAAVVASNKPITAVVKELEKKLDEQIKKEKALKLQQRKSEFKRVNLTAKVFRLEEAKAVLNDYKPNINKRDDMYFDAALKSAEYEVVKAEREEAKRVLSPVLAGLEGWRSKHLNQRKAAMAERVASEREVHVSKTVRAAIVDILNKLTTADEDAELAEYERMAEVLRVDSGASRDDFKRLGSTGSVE